jgi:hypothetical protein
MAQSAAARKVAYRLRHEVPFYAKHVLKIIDARGDLVPLVCNKAQLKLDRALEAQRAAGRPMRAVVLKSRKVGISTYTQARIFHDTTLEANCRSLVVAQDMDTAAELWEMSDTFYSHLPADPEFKPPLRSRLGGVGAKQLEWGERSRALRDRGEVGINSSLKIDTAKEVEAGRGKTIRKLHCSEVASWDSNVGTGRAKGAGTRKFLSLLNAVPDVPNSLIVLESTAKGHNLWKQRWDSAESGKGGYVQVFIGWTDDPQCSREFDSPEQRERFMAEEFGRGEYGEDEPWLVETFGCTPEQLWWRRVAIIDKANEDLDMFKQEYPSTPMESFAASGKQFFSYKLVSRAESEAKRFNPPPEIEGAEHQPGDGLFVPKGFRTVQMAMGTQEVPTGTLWLPASAAQAESGKDLWRVWSHPQKASEGRSHAAEKAEEARPYVVAVDVASGEDQTQDEPDYSAIQVIDHLTREQVAEWRSRCDRDEVAVQALLAAMWFNTALIAVETTGGYGTTVNEILAKRMRYRKLYRRRKQGSINQDRPQPLWGWDTSSNTKPLMEDGAVALLREGAAGIRSLRLIGEMRTYVRFENGRRGADTEAFDDLLMSWMIGQRVAQLIPPTITRPERRHHWNSIMGA